METPPPDDKSTTETGGGAETADRAEDAVEPPTQSVDQTDNRPPAAGGHDTGNKQSASSQPSHRTESPEVDSPVDSDWWYWVAAVPIYVVAGIVAAAIAGVLFLLGIVVDVSGGMGLGTTVVILLTLLGVVVYGLAGLAVSIMFPIGIYFDAKTLVASDVSWDPDPVLYLLVAAASVLLTAFTLSFVVALYYLYRRNQAVGVP